MTAGRRRRGRKATRRGRKGVKRGGGAGYGVNQGTPIAAGAASVGRADDGMFYDASTGAPRPEAPPVVGGRRRKSSKKSRKSRRKMRGGASQISMGGTYASFGGTGERGIPHYGQGVHAGNPF
jgi:hypothetical protein